MIIHLWGEFHISEILARREEGRSSTNLAVYLVECSLLYCRSSPKCTSHLKPPSPSLGIAGAGGGEGGGGGGGGGEGSGDNHLIFTSLCFPGRRGEHLLSLLWGMSGVTFDLSAVAFSRCLVI